MKKFYSVFFAFALLFTSVIGFADDNTPTTIGTATTTEASAPAVSAEPAPVAVTPAVITETSAPTTPSVNTTVVSDPTVSIAPLVPTNALKSLPGIKTGFLWDVQQQRVQPIATMSLIEYKNFSFEAGYSGDQTLVGVVSYPLFKLKDYGVTVPVLNLVECNVGIGVGVTDIGSSKDNNIAVGPTVSLINVKF